MRRLAIYGGGTALKLLCLGAHCDDIEIGCGGTILRLAAEHPGLDVTWVVFSGNDRRQEEAENGAAFFLAGAGSRRIVLHRFRESFLPAQAAEVKESFEALKAEIRPDLILSHYKDDAHQDHRLIADLTWNTFRDHLIWEYEIPKYEGDLANPNVLVPLDRALAISKAEALWEIFQSQHSRAWFSPDTFMSLMRLRGIQANAPDGLAEAFHCRKLVM